MKNLFPKSPHSQPQNWINPFRPLTTTKLAPDEKIALVMHYEVLHEGTDDKTQTVFAVIRKGNKAIARNYSCTQL